MNKENTIKFIQTIKDPKGIDLDIFTLKLIKEGGFDFSTSILIDSIESNVKESVILKLIESMPEEYCNDAFYDVIINSRNEKFLIKIAEKAINLDKTYCKQNTVLMLCLSNNFSNFLIKKVLEKTNNLS